MSSGDFSSSLKDMKPWQLQLMLENEHNKHSQSQQRNSQLETEIEELLKLNASLKEEVKTLKCGIEPLLKEKASQESMIKEMIAQESQLKERITQLESKLSEQSQFTIKKLKEGNEKLHERCENLKLELNSRPTQKQYRETCLLYTSPSPRDS